MNHPTKMGFVWKRLVTVCCDRFSFMPYSLWFVIITSNEYWCLALCLLVLLFPVFFVNFLLVLQDMSFSSEFSQRFCTADAQFSLLLRISHHYGKYGSQILLSMGALQNLSSCNLLGYQKKVRHEPFIS
jgi:hypothetical protein